MRIAAGLALAVAACATTLDIRTMDVGPTFNNEPVVIKGGCCLPYYGCLVDDKGVVWANYERRIPCFSTCGAVVEGHVRNGNFLADSRTPVEIYGGGLMAEQVCTR